MTHSKHPAILKEILGPHDINSPAFDRKIPGIGWHPLRVLSGNPGSK